jgi:hypothetical protein
MPLCSQFGQILRGDVDELRGKDGEQYLEIVFPEVVELPVSLVNAHVVFESFCPTSTFGHSEVCCWEV